MKKSKFEGRNAVSWTEQTTNDDTAMSYNIEGSLHLTLTIDLPGYLPILVSRMIELHNIITYLVSHIHIICSMIRSLDLILSEVRLFKRPVK